MADNSFSINASYEFCFITTKAVASDDRKEKDE